MKSCLILFLGIFIGFQLNAQGLIVPEDEKYVEDQIYLGMLYNSIPNPKDGIDNIGFPYVVQVGFIKDLPLNKQRNKAFGLGVGYQYDVLKPSVAMVMNQNVAEFTTIGDFSQFEYRQHQLAVPIEYRWRTSTAAKFTFWRLYGGLTYLRTFKNSVFYKASGVDQFFKNPSGIQKNKLAVHASVGYGTWNVYAKYILTPYFADKTTMEYQKIDFNQLQVGLIFYML